MKKTSHPENGPSPSPMNRADEVQDLLEAVQALIIPFIRAADENPTGLRAKSSILENHRPQDLTKLLNFSLPDSEGKGKQGLLKLIEVVLKYSVNTWDQGFLDKLYASTNAPGVVAELVLAVLNTNVHVYQVSPALTIIEKITARKFANLFGFEGPHAGGISTQGGSASNLTSVILARNNLFPDTKHDGNGSRDFVLFASSHGHYSLEKAANICGLGTKNVWSIPVDSLGCMIPEELEKLVHRAKDEGRTPLYVSATAGTTVLGSYDPFSTIADICKKHNLWFHVDACWGGPAIFSSKQKHKLAGIEKANSVAVNPHKMMGAPVTCSFLLGPNLKTFHKANTLPAGYLFHESSGEEVWDLADLTLQCGRRGDSLKLALSWVYYGREGYERMYQKMPMLVGD